MAAAVGKYAANKLLKQQMKKYQNKNDDNVSNGDNPFFGKVSRATGGGKKRMKKQIPAYIPEHDATLLAKFRVRAYKLDMGLFKLFGIRFGYSSVIGLIPFAGDFADAIIAAGLMFYYCSRLEARPGTGVWIQMIINIAIDTLIGFVPLLGDVFDAYFKANTRNVRVLEQHLDRVYKPKEAMAYDQEFKRRHPKDELPPATVYEDFSDEEDDRQEFIRQDRQQSRQQTRQQSVRKPQPAVTKETRGGGGWFSGIGKSRRPADVEMAQDAPARPPRPNNDAQEAGTVRGGRR